VKGEKVERRSSEYTFKQQLKRDIFTVVERFLGLKEPHNITVKAGHIQNLKAKRYVLISIGRLLQILLNNFPLTYKKNNKILVTRYDTLEAIRELGICSTFKFKGRNPKRCKIIIRKVINHEYQK